jgi:hypothetical protein
MSENVLILIPTDELFLPEYTAQKEAGKFLASFFPEDASIYVRITDQVEFVDQGANFEAIFCPFCNSLIDEDWWEEAMEAAHQLRFKDLTIVTPCCRLPSSLNSLVYWLPAGFSRFAMVVRNPQKDIGKEQIELIGDTLGCEVKKIWARY